MREATPVRVLRRLSTGEHQGHGNRGGGNFNGNAAPGNVPGNGFFPVVLREGTTKITGGTYNVTGEMVLGGVVAHGGPGTNNLLQMDAGTLNISGFFSIGSMHSPDERL